VVSLMDRLVIAVCLVAAGFAAGLICGERNKQEECSAKETRQTEQRARAFQACAGYAELPVVLMRPDGADQVSCVGFSHYGAPKAARKATTGAK
jgi:hypothetical protein